MQIWNKATSAMKNICIICKLLSLSGCTNSRPSIIWLLGGIDQYIWKNLCYGSSLKYRRDIGWIFFFFKDIEDS